MAAGFIRDTQIAAGQPPFDAVRKDLTASGTVLREKMREFMAQGALNLGWRDLNEFRVQRDRLGSPAGEPSRRSKSRVPLDSHLKSAATCRPEKLAAESFQEDVALEARLAGLRVAIRSVGKKAQMAKNGFSEIEHDELGLFHQAAMG
jgi:hypothetical protein